MNTFLDIVGSIIVGAMVILSFAQFMSTKQSSQLEADNQLISQVAISDVSEQLQYDLRKIGYRCAGCPFITIGENAITFLYDADNNGWPDTVRYWLGNDITATTNPSDKFLNRRVNQDAVFAIQSGVVGLEFEYFTAANQPTTSPAETRTVQVKLRVQPPTEVDGAYPESVTTFRVTPKNIH